MKPTRFSTTIWYCNNFWLQQRWRQYWHRILSSPNSILQLVKKVVIIIIRTSSFKEVQKALCLQKLQYLWEMKIILNPRQKVNLTAFISERVIWIFRETQCSERNNHQPLNKITSTVQRHPESRCMQPKYLALCKPQVEQSEITPEKAQCGSKSNLWELWDF